MERVKHWRDRTAPGGIQVAAHRLDTATPPTYATDNRAKASSRYPKASPKRTRRPTISPATNSRYSGWLTRGNRSASRLPMSSIKWATARPRVGCESARRVATFARCGPSIEQSEHARRQRQRVPIDNRRANTCTSARSTGATRAANRGSMTWQSITKLRHSTRRPTHSTQTQKARCRKHGTHSPSLRRKTRDSTRCEAPEARRKLSGEEWLAEKGKVRATGIGAVNGAAGDVPAALQSLATIGVRAAFEGAEGIEANAAHVPLPPPDASPTAGYMFVLANEAARGAYEKRSPE